jgi:integrase
MANIYRPLTIRYLDKDGRQVPKNTLGARQKRIRLKTWRARYRDASGEPRTASLRTEDRQEAQERLADLTLKLKQRESDPYAEHRDKPLSEHLEDYQMHLESKNSSNKHIAKSVAYIGRIIVDCDFKSLPDFDANTAASYLHERRQPVPTTQVSLKHVSQIISDAGMRKPSVGKLKRQCPSSPAVEARRGSAALWNWTTLRPWLKSAFDCSLPRQCPLPDERGISIYASNDYLAALKAFANWLVRSRRLAENPFRYLAKLNPATEQNRKHDRRPASDTDFEQLIAATINSKPFRSLTGRDRIMLYLLAVNTGFRVSELASLTSSRFDFAGDVPTVTVLAAYSKRRKTDTRPLPKDLAESLGQFLDERRLAKAGSEESHIWPGSWPEKAAVMLRRDLEAAGIPYQDGAGRFLDFHSLRHTFGTNLARAGVAPKVAQELMRHSDVNLTLGIYSHMEMSDLAGAVGKLPKNHIERRPESTDTGFSCAKVATQTGNLGNYQVLSDVTDDQSGRLSPLRSGEHKPQTEKGVTQKLSAHKKEPPLGLEPRTYALRKRRSAN